PRSKYVEPCQNIQNQNQNLQNQIATLTEMMSKLISANAASSSGSGTLSGTKVTKDQVQTSSSQSTAHVQPSIIESESQDPVSEPVVVPVSAPMPNLKPSIPYPSRHKNEKRRDQANEQIEKFYEIFKEMSFEISFTDALILMPKFASTLKALIGNKEKLSEMARTTMMNIAIRVNWCRLMREGENDMWVWGQGHMGRSREGLGTVQVRRELTPPPGFSTPPQIPNITTSERPPVITTVFATTTPKNTPCAYHASTSTNPNPTISPAFVEANYEILESHLRERRRPEPRMEATPTLWLRSIGVRKQRKRVVGFKDTPNREGNRRGRNAECIKPSEIEVKEGENRGRIFPHFWWLTWEEMKTVNPYGHL
nr:reverse transcriptase domain-containing protein [Tanacetum cinerariifolium]